MGDMKQKVSDCYQMNDELKDAVRNAFTTIILQMFKMIWRELQFCKYSNGVQKDSRDLR